MSIQENPDIDYRLTWPAALPGVCVIAGQWQRNEAGEIEATYTREQLSACNEVMKECKQNATH